MTLRLTNTLTRRTEPFEPRVPGEVTIYCCGVTVYDLCHLGHARSYIVWDVLRRYLIWRGFRVTFVQNITDIDDKILRRAAEEGSSMEAVSERNITAFRDDMNALNILPPDRTPRATKCLDGIRAMIAELEASGAAYSADGDVYFAVMGRPDYGKLSGRSLSDQLEGASGRLNSDEESRKRHPFDFALWKGVKPGEPSFPSPWGPGRPGWHIECSAMVRQELGTTIDIHLGGSDLIFPHHENEIAQSEAVNGVPLAHYWLHNGMVNVDGEKMSKSLGNFTTIRALLSSGVSAMTLRLFVLQAHYRKPLDFTREALEAAATGWHGLNEALGLGLNRAFSEPLGWADAAPGHDTGLETSRQDFIDALDDDLNTSAALAVLFELTRPLRALARRLERGSSPSGQDRALQGRWLLLQELSGVLGLKPESPSSSEAEAGAGPEPAEIQALISERLAARQEKRYSEADSIRDRLRSAGIELIDRPDGSTEWIRR
ncbi:cysteine--tRNA ligase [Synechococcus sp. BA-124 BA4]|uniref:cysteine--tRNA ligase n=1 Tax=unclassified Synechococcus TaxID=2626047 RepID=UPI0018CCB645|nr:MULTISPECIES: cysteine--tRNA ligase [unclassified Synechococcus]MEA5399306.1 cysteine--tRNA ligase [Synechococcus sp. BA-124 BA4]QPN56061.1 cysteine--tRNA ligase [Synechococcus sp. CBW1107]CAK6699566.1 Cysteine--tRNA ligase [Synechococcus sp. CBW1107]